MIFHPIDDYESLGRFIIEQTYSILLHNPWIHDYRQLKGEIQDILQIYPFVDKSFAMYEYNHGNSEYHFCKYRWENVMDYYIKQQCNALFLQHVINPFGNIDSINLIEPYNHTLLKEKDLSCMVDKAKERNRHRTNNNILQYRNWRIETQKKYEDYVRGKKRQ